MKSPSTELLSKRTRNLFREHLVSWTVAQIRTAFDEVGITPDLSYQPPESGERRRFVEQLYRTVDFTQPRDVAKVVAAFAGIIRASLLGGADRKVAEPLQAALRSDGFVYTNGGLTPISPGARQVLDQGHPGRTVSELTRRAIIDVLQTTPGGWSGHLGDVEFLSRLYDLRALPSDDTRFSSMDADIWQHRVNNDDWPDDWVFFDERLALLHGPDDVFLRFVAETAHPIVRPEEEEASRLVKHLNEQLAHDGWSLAIKRRLSGRPVYEAVRHSSTVALPEQQHGDILSDEYVRELSAKCDARLSSGDLEGAVTVARTMLEAVLGELEERLAGHRNDYKGELPKQFKAVAKLLKMDDERPELDDRFKDVVRGLVSVVSGLAPLRNRISDGHARAKKPAPHHVRVVVNAARTVSTFLVESYNYQRARKTGSEKSD